MVDRTMTMNMRLADEIKKPTAESDDDQTQQFRQAVLDQLRAIHGIVARVPSLRNTYDSVKPDRASPTRDSVCGGCCKYSCLIVVVATVASYVVLMIQATPLS
jgi:hypothetical protein